MVADAGYSNAFFVLRRGMALGGVGVVWRLEYVVVVGACVAFCLYSWTVGFGWF